MPLTSEQMPPLDSDSAPLGPLAVLGVLGVLAALGELAALGALAALGELAALGALAALGPELPLLALAWLMLMTKGAT